jgi:hypothetical protein
MSLKVPRLSRRATLHFGEGEPASEKGSETEPASRNGMRAWLESPVREAAVVYINDQRAGSVWKPPYELDVARFLHAGENRIRIVVGNLAINALAGQKLPDYKDLIAKYGDRFQPQDLINLKPLPSGLQKPVELWLE